MLMTKFLAVLTAVYVVAGSSGAWALSGYDGNNDPIIPDNVQMPQYRPVPPAAHHGHTRHGEPRRAY
jgi:hypothetical protein